MVQADPLSVSISSASAYATGVFFTLLASPSLTSLNQVPVEPGQSLRQISATSIISVVFLPPVQLVPIPQ